jgi:hypothetical protein
MRLQILDIIEELRDNDPIYHKLVDLFQNETNMYMKNNYLMAMEYKENIYHKKATDILYNLNNKSCPNRSIKFIQKYHKTIVASSISLIITNVLHRVPSVLISIVRLVSQAITLTIVSPIYVPFMSIQSAINLALFYLPFSTAPLQFSFSPQDISKSVANAIDILANEISKQGGDELANTFYYIVFVIILAVVYISLICLEKTTQFRSATISIGYLNFEFVPPIGKIIKECETLSQNQQDHQHNPQIQHQNLPLLIKD